HRLHPRRLRERGIAGVRGGRASSLAVIPSREDGEESPANRRGTLRMRGIPRYARDDRCVHFRFTLRMLSDFIARARRLVVLTGAGCSTESGIPDYRSPGGAWTRHKPISYASFVRSAEVRRFYWARSYRGWPRFESARPNAAHQALARLEERGGVHQLITQNVDDLHQEAGSRAV